MVEEIIDIKDGVKLHLIHNDIFKTNMISVFLLTDLNRENVTKNALIPLVLKRGTEKLSTMQNINIRLEEMYGSSFGISIDKLGDTQAIQSYIMCIDNGYTFDNETLLVEGLEFICNVLFYPKHNGDAFDGEYVKQEKEKLREIIKGKINNKGSYAQSRMIEEMCKNDAYGIYKYGYEEDLDDIDEKNLYVQYKNIIQNSEIHIFVCGKIDKTEVLNELENRLNKLDRKCEYKHKISMYKPYSNEIRKVFEEQEVTQGKLVIGYNVDIDISSKEYYAMIVYNAILGSSASSKLFQNVREKESLAYTIRSKYIKQKNILMIAAGIELSDYDKAVRLIDVQVNDMKSGNFSNEDINAAKVFLKNIYRSYTDDQSVMINFYMERELINRQDTLEDTISNIDNITKEDIINVANKIKKDTIYFLTSNEMGV